MLKNTALVLSNSAGQRISDLCLTHGGSETRFVAPFKRLVLPNISEGNLNTTELSQRRSGCVIVPKDTDVTTILALAPCMRDMNVINVLGESVIDLDAVAATFSQKGITRNMLARS